MANSSTETAPPPHRSVAADQPAYGHGAEPIRGELFGLDRLEAHARALAQTAGVARPGESPRADFSLRRRFAENGRRLAQARDVIVEASERGEPLPPDAEWMLDNYHIIDDTLREVRQDLPRGYYRELPKLVSGPFRGMPRVYALGVELVAHTDSVLDDANLTRFVEVFQQVAPLKIGELWAVPIMLRIVLLENLRRLADQMVETRQERRRAEEYAATIADRVRQAGGNPVKLDWSDSCVVRLVQVLREQGGDAAAHVEWLENCLARHGNGRVDLVRREHGRQAANQVSVGNCVTSLRLLSNVDWAVFFDKTSVVEAILRDDPARVYARQNFGTKDRYRRAVERLARYARIEEPAVARRAVERARQALTSDEDLAASAAGHVGYYLDGRGRYAFERELGYRAPVGERLLRLAYEYPERVYFPALAAVTAGVLAAVVAAAGARGGWRVAIVLAALLPASEIAVAVVHYLVTLLLPPRVLPKFDFKDGIPADCATFVVMPTLLSKPEDATHLVERLELHYLSNPDAQLRFALLTDFADAPSEHRPEDDAVVKAALSQVQALNARYAAGGPDRFFLFHRRRKWNPAQGCWMGYERKRGKLGEFNRLLRGAGDTSYGVVSGDLGKLPFIRYVITLDADTQLPRESAERLVAALSHPLNRPRFDSQSGRVVEGYGVLQPRVSLSLLAGTRSLFARILASSAGIDPYTTAVSDVYEDLFGRGTYTGKGIYDVDAFEAATGHTFPDNRILSHDLIEGNYARCGLITDVELLDDFPARYNAYARREHRWVRGDWQIAQWLFARVPTTDRTPHESPAADASSGLSTNGAAAPVSAALPAPPIPTRENTLGALERWKLLDNLRRSLMPPALVVLLALGWMLLPGAPALWSGLALLTVAMPLVILLVNTLLGLLRRGSWLLQLREARGAVASTAGQVLLFAGFLAFQAYYLMDAIVRTLWRLGVSRRNLLEWETASAAERRLQSGLTHFWVAMAAAPATAAVLAVLTAVVRPAALPAAMPWLLAWFASPALAWFVSQPRKTVKRPFSAEEVRSLRRIARKTWHFFDTFVTAEDHWLPPDNYQEIPKGQVAHRTSPTNMGLYLLSCVAANDLGYLSASGLAERMGNTLDTFDKLERHRGHFHNWYDTSTLAILQPPYVSTVDSGNLLGCLLTLKQALLAKKADVLRLDVVRAGLADTLYLAREALRAIEPPAEGPTVEPLRAMNAAADDLAAELGGATPDLLSARAWLDRLAERARDLRARVPALAAALGEEPEELTAWADRLAAEACGWQAELTSLAPWLKVLQPAPEPVPARGTEATPAAWRELRLALVDPNALADVAATRRKATAKLDEIARSSAAGTALASVEAIRDAIEQSAAVGMETRLEALAERADAFARAMNFRFLYNGQRNLFSIGLNLAAKALDQSHYDLLASESALTSFLAVARGDVPKKHWFHLSRQLTRAPGGRVVLLSWGGTMFEYLMPRLLWRSYDGTLLDESCQGAVARQMEYGQQMRVPWGISESGFAALDAALDYQYQSFGVPGLGLKRGLSRDLVIAPYATALALAVRPHDAAANFRALTAERAEGAYGFHEAVDYTRDRLREKRRSAVIRSYMSHHQGMSLVALANCLLGAPMVRRFHNEPMVRATELLLQEKMPLAAPVIDLHEDEVSPEPVVREGVLPMSRHIRTPDTPHPRTHLLSNGQYSVMLTNTGAGFSTWREFDVTRWREDRTTDARGQWIYLRDARTNFAWSAAYQPLGAAAESYEAVFSTDKVEFRRRDRGMETHLEVTVSPEHAAEVRRLTLTNHNLRAQEVEITSYVEVVLAPHASDVAHPAFGKLFLETEWLAGRDALLCRRRPRGADQNPLWCVHVVAVDGPAVGATQYETDRNRFLGRGRDATAPAALEAALAGTTGPVLDPVLALRKRVRVAPGASVSVSFTTAVTTSRDDALALVDQYRDVHGVTRTFELAWAHTQVQLRHLKLSAEQAHLFQRLAAHVLYGGPTLRAPAAVIAANRQGQPGLWRHGISGDKPIVLLRIGDGEELGVARDVLLAHAYWRLHGLEVDLVLLNEHPTSYQDELSQQLQALVRSSDSHSLIDRPGGIFVRRSDQMSEDDRNLLLASARVVLVGSRGSLSAQMERNEAPPQLPAPLQVTGTSAAPREASAGVPMPGDLLFFNGIGGFTPDGREYVIGVPGRAGDARDKVAPAPWSNVVANAACGFLVTEGGAGYTWAGNSQMNRLTPWSNDPVCDPPGEVLYLRDETTGRVWTPTPRPLGVGPSVVRHGQGYSTFASVGNGLRVETTVFVPPADPVKIYRLTVRNEASGARRLSATFFAEWVLGATRDPVPMHVVTEEDSADGVILARNVFNADFANAVAFADVNVRPRTATGDRTEFLGRNGSVAAPAALRRSGLAGRFGVALDPCVALLAPFELKAGESREIVFVLGQADSADRARQLATRYREPREAAAALEQVRQQWDRLLTAVQVRTPDAAFDLFLNRWLLYQVRSCRVQGRTAFYQSSGAYGFRDQLQDVMALVWSAPEETKAQILLAASRQFAEGDVQHWWHPPAGRGVRTRFSDDFLWLPLVVQFYVEITGDASILDQPVSFLKAPPLRADQEEDFGLPQVAEEAASIYEHCVRSIENGWHYGPHGLPLMGTGDWNDGMNRVGPHRVVSEETGIVQYDWNGQGESVWDAWFQITVLGRWAGLADRRGDAGRATKWRDESARLREAVEAHAWDGEWYRRAYFDDGTPLGTAQGTECRIDSLAQTWAVISGAADPERARQAMRAAYEQLVRTEDGIILLLAPPFDKGNLHPGYIKGYVPGIRENGGQYSHGAVWVALAAALQGEGSRAVDLFGLLNPINHGATRETIAKYKVEPYVMAGDVYGAAPHTGRGGWSWYTGSAGWMYRVGLEAILGFHRQGDRLRIDPCVAAGWKEFAISFRHGSSTYRIVVENAKQVERGVSQIAADGRSVEGSEVTLVDDGREHEIRVVMG